MIRKRVWRPSCIATAAAAEQRAAQGSGVRGTPSSGPAIRTAPKEEVAASHQGILLALEGELNSFSRLAARALEMPVGTFQAASESMPAQRLNDLRGDLFKVSRLLLKLAVRVPTKAVPRE